MACSLLLGINVCHGKVGSPDPLFDITLVQLAIVASVMFIPSLSDQRPALDTSRSAAELRLLCRRDDEGGSGSCLNG
jgi:hypothetical protein